MATATKDYRKLAEEQYNPGYNMRKVALQNLLSGNVAALNSQKTGINSNYDSQIKANNLNYAMTGNNFNNNTLSRGMGRSTIFTTGMAGIEGERNATDNAINTNRNSELGNIDSQIAQQNTSVNSQLQQLDADKEDEISAIIQKLTQQDIENTRADKQLADQEAATKFSQDMSTNQYNNDLAQQKFSNDMTTKQYNNSVAQQKYENDLNTKKYNSSIAQQNFENNLATKNYNLSVSKAKSSGSGSSGSSSSKKANAEASAREQLALHTKKGDALNWLQANEGNFVRAGLGTWYDKTLKALKASYMSTTNLNRRSTQMKSALDFSD